MDKEAASGFAGDHVRHPGRTATTHQRLLKEGKGRDVDGKGDDYEAALDLDQAKGSFAGAVGRVVVLERGFDQNVRERTTIRPGAA